MRRKGPTFYCEYTIVEENAPCHSLKIKEAELEGMIYEVMSKQAKVILNVDDISRAKIWRSSLPSRRRAAGRWKPAWNGSGRSMSGSC